MIGVIGFFILFFTDMKSENEGEILLLIRISGQTGLTRLIGSRILRIGVCGRPGPASCHSHHQLLTGTNASSIYSMPIR
jgi:hypothetical protein